MYLVLCIAQHTTIKLPKDLAFYQLGRLTLTAQRYDLNHILIGYLDKWIEPHRENLLKPGFENWLYIAWQFGLVAEYLTLANHLAVHCEANRGGMLVSSTFGRPLNHDAFPPQTISQSHQSSDHVAPANKHRYRPDRSLPAHGHLGYLLIYPRMD